MELGKDPRTRKSFRFASYAFATVGAVSTAMVVSRAAIALFGPGIPYRFAETPQWPLDGRDFQRYLSIITDSAIQPKTGIEVLTNGEVFYPAQFDAISKARSNIHIEAYEFFEGKLTRDLLALLTERARNGVAVRMVIDALGSFATRDKYFADLRHAGGEVCWYHPLRFSKWPKANNRTHRKMLIIDGTTAFVGGADYADHWIYSTRTEPRWRDTVFKIEGEAVGAVQSVFAENWLESSGFILAEKQQFPSRDGAGESCALIINSTPGGGATRSRMLFQTMLETATKSIHITSPYFLPDRSARSAMFRALDRGVEIKIVTAGAHNDHPSIGRYSRSLCRKLLYAGAEMYGYSPAMIHAKTMTIDGCWAIIGSTNFDHRSFDLNDEVNLAIYDPVLVRRIEDDLTNDVARSERITSRKAADHSFAEHLESNIGALLHREE